MLPRRCGDIPCRPQRLPEQCFRLDDPRIFESDGTNGRERASATRHVAGYGVLQEWRRALFEADELFLGRSKRDASGKLAASAE